MNDFSKTRPLFRSDAPPALEEIPASTSPLVGWARPQHRTPPRGSLTPQSARRLNKCMFLEFDESEGRWRDALHKTGRVERAPVQLTPRRDERRRSNPAMAAIPMQPAAWENPVVVGLLLALCPPIGVTLAWSSRTIPQAGRIALTVFGGFVMLVATVVAAMFLI